MKRLLAICALLALMLAGCGAHGGDAPSAATSYTQVSQDVAMQMMEENQDYVILDVRTHEEYAAAHIEDAICIPLNRIEAEAPEKLPDTDQLIFVYCRTGNRSQQASELLFNMGYTNVVEFGGIETWPGSIVERLDGPDEMAN